MYSARSLLKRSPSRYNATVLFCDIRGFSTLFDERDPMDALLFANAVLGDLGAVVEASGGHIEKFMGDGFLCHFGVVEEIDDHAARACECAVRMRVALTRLNFQRYIEDQPVIAIGIGIHTGIMAGGVIASSSKAEFSVIGDVVNTASRIEGLTKFFSVDCLVSESTYNSCKEKFTFQAMPYKELRGVRAKQLTFWLLPTNLFLDT